MVWPVFKLETFETGEIIQIFLSIATIDSFISLKVNNRIIFLFTKRIRELSKVVKLFLFHMEVKLCFLCGEIVIHFSKSFIFSIKMHCEFATVVNGENYVYMKNMYHFSYKGEIYSLVFTICQKKK